MSNFPTTDWDSWSRSAWRRHLPGAADIGTLVAGFGNATIPELAHITAEVFPDRQAVRVESAGITHGQLDRAAARVSGCLRSRVQPQDRVMIAGPTSRHWLAAYLGTLRSGAVAVLVNPSSTASELQQVVDASGASLALVHGDVGARIAGLPRPPATITVDMALAHPAEPWRLRGTPESTALLAFTSGTTGRPKGVPLTHRALLTSIRSAMAAWDWTEDDILVHALPLHHQHGLSGLHATLISGSRLHLLTRFGADELMGAIRESGATVLFAVPTMYQRLADLPAGLPARAGRLRLCICGSAPLGRQTSQGAARVLGQVPLVRYGTTESGLDTSHLLSELRDGRYAETVGLPLPGVSVRLADDGEIQVRGPQVFGGYWQDGEATAEVLTEDGWFRTGDIGGLDGSGHLVVSGRSKEVIISGGLNVHPREVELALECHPAVAEAAVAGLPDVHWGEQVSAWVVLRPGISPDPESLILHAKSLLAPHKCPKQVAIVDHLPRNALGKLDRRKLAG